jgi:hypothetical protein
MDRRLSTIEVSVGLTPSSPQDPRELATLFVAEAAHPSSLSSHVARVLVHEVEGWVSPHLRWRSGH